MASVPPINAALSRRYGSTLSAHVVEALPAVLDRPLCFRSGPI